jgi:endo-1,4-beta-xylanase
MKLFNRLKNQFYQMKPLHRHAVLALAFAVTLGGCIGGSYALIMSKASPVRVSTTAPTHFADTLLDGQWSYLPGSKREADGLLIQPYDFKIVQQDGSGGQSNYPVNAYGTHLEDATNFTVSAKLKDIHGKAAMTLYNKLPVIADEFRVERGSIRAELDGTTLHVTVWDGVGQQPVIDASYPVTDPGKNPPSITISRSGGLLEVSANYGSSIHIAQNDLFNDGFVWFGFDAQGGSFKLSGLSARNSSAPRSSSFRVVDSSTLHITPADGGLQALAAKKRPDFTVGAAMALNPVVSDAAYATTAFGGNFGILTTENALKWQFTEPMRGQFDFKEGDALVQLAKRHNMKVHGHTLVFGEANPAWVRSTPPDQLQTVMVDHIKKTVTHFKGNIYSWDVVNEPFDDTNWDQFRHNIWYNAMGEAYIATAFRTAHDADPAALLFMNEYGIEEDGDRWNNFLALVTRLKQAGVPINGVGFQSHVYESGDKINPSVLRRHMQQLAAIGVQSRVSEMDVYSEDGQGVQASQFSSILQACLAESSCISWTTWGISDRYDYFIDDDGSVQQGNDFLWDENMKPTPAIKALQDVLR